MSETEKPDDCPGLAEKIAYGAGNMAGTVVVSVGSFLMYFYTDVAGVAAATAGGMLLAVKVWDAIWDIFVGRIVDRTRTRWGQCKPFLLVGALLFPLVMAWTFNLPEIEGLTRWLWLGAGYVALQMTFSLIMIPYQSLPVLMTSRSDQRVHLYGAQALATFATVMLVNGATMALVSFLGGGNKALGFLMTMSLWGLVGSAGVLSIALLARERIVVHGDGKGNLSTELRFLFTHRSWQSLAAVKMLFTVGLNLQLGLSVYYATVVIGSPAAIGPVMLAGAVGLVVGVPTCMLILRRACPKWVATVTFAGAAIASLGFIFLPQGNLVAALLLNALVGFMIGTSGPAFGPSTPNMVDHVELDTGRRLMGLGVSTLNFAEKVGGGVASGLIGALLSAIGYVGGLAPTTTVTNGVAGALSFGPALFFGLAALVFWLAFPLNRHAVEHVREQLRTHREPQH